MITAEIAAALQTWQFHVFSGVITVDHCDHHPQASLAAPTSVVSTNMPGGMATGHLPFRL